MQNKGRSIVASRIGNNMEGNPVVAIVGVTGLVGSEALACLEESKIEFSDLRLFASSESEGEVYSCRDSEYKVEQLEDDSFDGVDIALFALGADLAARYVPPAVEAGAVVIDSSSQFRGEEGVPLVVPEVNFASVTPDHKIIACPNPSTVLLAPMFAGIEREVGLKRIVISAYEAVSGAGRDALDELWSQTLAIFNQREIVSEAFQHQIAFNCIPQIDVIRGDGTTKEESRIVTETQKVLNLPDLRMAVTAVRVPVFHSHGFSINIETGKELDPEHCASLLRSIEGVEVAADPMEYPMQLGATGSDALHVGRIRRDFSLPAGVNLWAVGDNVRKGAALNMIRIAQRVIG